MGSISSLAQGGGFPFQTGFGPTTTPGGFSGQSFGAPGITGFGFPPPLVDPFFFFTPAASSFNINRLLGAANGTSVPINVGPTPSTLGISPFILGFPFFGGGNGGNALGGGTGGLDALMGTTTGTDATTAALLAQQQQQQALLAQQQQQALLLQGSVASTGFDMTGMSVANPFGASGFF